MAYNATSFSTSQVSIKCYNRVSVSFVLQPSDIFVMTLFWNGSEHKTVEIRLQRPLNLDM